MHPVAVLTLLIGIMMGLDTATARAQSPRPPTLLLHHGKIVTVDSQFQIAEAMAVQGDRIVSVGGNNKVLALAGPNSKQIDLEGKTVLPGLIDSHCHPVDAAMFEFDHEVPDMQTIADVLRYVKSRAAALKPGEWVFLEQVYITRLREQRLPTRRELDEAAPNNPVWYCTGPDTALNSLGLKLSGIDKDFKITDGQAGFVERDPATGEPTGILRNGNRLVKYKSPDKIPTADQRREQLAALLSAYNEVGITSVVDREAHDDHIRCYQELKNRGELSCRVFLTYFLDAQQPLEKIESQVLQAARHPLRQYDNMLWLRGVKIYLDGGMLTGSAYMLQPWGVSRIYSITDRQYRGLLFIEPDRLYQLARAVLSHDLQITAHCVGDGAVENLVAAYRRVDRDFPVRRTRPCISHSNFMTLDAIRKMREIGVVADLQPIWLHLDGSTLLKQFGDQRLTYFQPYRTLFEQGVIVAGGSDHMQKIGRRRSINSYDPFLGMWTMLVRQPRWIDKPLHPEQCISREQAIRLYTINGAYLTFEEKEKGSLEKGKLADFIILDRDILKCPLDEVKDTEVLQTYLGGKSVFTARKK